MEEIHNCKNINSKPSSFFFQKGIGKGAKILILGESLGKDNILHLGKAFYTTSGKIVPTGKRLNEELKILNLSFEKCSFTEIAKCYLGNNRKILKTCGLKSGEHLISQLKAYKIKLVISLGVTTKDILEKIFDIKLPMGEITKVKNKWSILPIYHPSPASPHGHKKNLVIIMKNKKEIKKNN
ncbi:MAG: uracil-DNA glycosylase family protein [Candidatus Magasanikbacteria bacterium]|nr:uracil-DNA glycosylase family protein [Candidatus Magasanikbacteria bacterium]